MEDDLTPCSVCGEPVMYGSRHHQCGTLVLDVMRAADKYWEASTAARQRVRAELEAAVTAALSRAARGVDVPVEAQPAAWMTDEPEPRTCAAHQKASMPRQIAESYCIPLVRAAGVGGTFNDQQEKLHE